MPPVPQDECFAPLAAFEAHEAVGEGDEQAITLLQALFAHDPRLAPCKSETRAHGAERAPFPTRSPFPGPGNGPLARLLRAVVTLAQYRLLCGAMLQNAQTIHPVSDLHRLLETRDAHLLAALLDSFGLRIPHLAKFRQGAFLQSLTAAGTGMFPVANCTNHSCEPNVVSVTRQTGADPSAMWARSTPTPVARCLLIAPKMGRCLLRARSW